MLLHGGKQTDTGQDANGLANKTVLVQVCALQTSLFALKLNH